MGEALPIGLEMGLPGIAEGPLPFPVSLRDAKEGDRNYIYGNWLDSYKADSRPGGWLATMRWPRYRTLQTDVIRRCLEAGTYVGDAATVVAHLPDDEDHLLGFATGSNVEGIPVLHYVQVRAERRRVGLGLALALLVRTKIGGLAEYSHSTRAGVGLALRLNLNLNPLGIPR